MADGWPVLSGAGAGVGALEAAALRALAASMAVRRVLVMATWSSRAVGEVKAKTYDSVATILMETLALVAGVCCRSACQDQYATKTARPPPPPAALCQGQDALVMSDTAMVSDGGAPGGAAGVQRTVRLSWDTERTPSCFLYEADTRDMLFGWRGCKSARRACGCFVSDAATSIQADALPMICGLRLILPAS